MKRAEFSILFELIQFYTETHRVVSDVRKWSIWFEPRDKFASLKNRSFPHSLTMKKKTC